MAQCVSMDVFDDQWSDTRAPLTPPKPVEINRVERLRNIQRSRSHLEIESELSSEHKGRVLLGFSQQLYASRCYNVKRFEPLSLLNVLHAQHKLIEIEEQIHQNRGEILNVESDNLHAALERYHAAVNILRDMAELRQPPPGAGCTKTRAQLAISLRQPRYRDACDALDLVDLKSQDPAKSADYVRQFLQRKIPVRFLDEEGFNQRVLSACVGALRISPAVDTLARLLVSVLGGVLLLVPMAALLHIRSPTYALITLILSVIIFQIVITTCSNASNHEVFVATAGYAAVLAVFMGSAFPASSAQPPV